MKYLETKLTTVLVTGYCKYKYDMEETSREHFNNI